MAIKAALAASLLVALVVAASASSYTTIITTTSYDEEGMIRQGREEGQQCRQKVQGQEFQSCQRYLRQGRSNPQQQEYQEQCCQELKEMDRYQCGCEALRQAVQKAQQGGTSYPGQGEGHQSQGQQIYERARQLPRVCNLRQQQCRFNLVFV